MSKTHLTIQEFTLRYVVAYLWKARNLLLWPPAVAAILGLGFVLLCPPDVIPHMYSAKRTHRLVMNLDNTPEVLRGVLVLTPADYVVETVQKSDFPPDTRVIVIPERGQVVVELTSADVEASSDKLDLVLHGSYAAGKVGLKAEASKLLDRIDDLRASAKGKVDEADPAKTDLVVKALQRYLADDYGPLGGVSNQPEAAPDRRALYVEVFVLLVFFACLAIHLILSRKKEQP